MSKGNNSSLHEAATDCTAKCKARVSHTFGIKNPPRHLIGEGYALGARSFSGNPYDAQTLTPALKKSPSRPAACPLSPSLIAAMAWGPART
ncbi:hypothetical protein [Paracoccus ravus]|uniref:hypothetical protein n=1 Tax=Paracoccus ravus TaxID=2447760 RepID=UPI00106DF947|nr:hypothetical protein [Paracoccus ravus]